MEQYLKSKNWIARVWLLEELFYYEYLFSFPNIFQTKFIKDQLEVRFKFIQIFSFVNIKKYFIELVQLFKEQDLIEEHYKIIYNGYYYFTKEFNTHDISEGFVIYEKLSI